MHLPLLSTEYLINNNYHILNLPPKVLQFGTGILLRGLPDYFIHNANQQNIFNGSVVVVKSTTNGNVDEFEKQNNLFTHFINGVQNNQTINKNCINQSIKEVLSAQHDWTKICKYAKEESIEIIISNVTEKGLVLDENDDIHNHLISYPCKLLALLYTRWIHFNGNEDKGWVILPTELIPNNGDVLLNLVIELAVKNNLPTNFINWIKTANEFCNTLVDRIVTNNISNTDKNTLQYSDNLMINSEPFALWAIELKNNQKVQKLSFSICNNEVVITDNIQKYITLKLRLLNATHTLLCGICLLTNVDTVYNSMQLPSIKNIIKPLMFEEIIPCIVGAENISLVEAIQFANNVLDRFNNPYSIHYWETIAFNFEEKMKTRVSFLIEKYIHLKDKAPEMICYGFACFYLYMKFILNKDIHIDDYCKSDIFKNKIIEILELDIEKFKNKFQIKL